MLPRDQFQFISLEILLFIDDLSPYYHTYLVENSNEYTISLITE
jgi:hypothetical protein